MHEESKKQASPTIISLTYSKIKSFLGQIREKQLTKAQLQSYLNQQLQHTLQLQSQFCLNSISDIKSLEKPSIVTVQLMVHDVQEGGYSNPYLISQPFNQNSDIQILRFGNYWSSQEQQNNIRLKLEDPKYFKFLRDFQTIICFPVLHETQWCKNINGNKLKNLQKVQVVVDFRCKYKLGEIINIIGLWRPDEQKLYFIKQVPKQKLLQSDSLKKYLSLQIKDFNETRKELLTFLSKFVSQKYAYFALYSILSRKFFFISAEWNMSEIVKMLLPRVNLVTIKAPFQKSLFPFKNQEEEIVNTPMEMCVNHTYTILDFSSLSQDKQVKIKQEEIDNLKALKIFVEQGQTIYRWLYGESLIPHSHTGMIIKASTIINPQFIIKGEKEFDLSQIQAITSEVSQQKWHLYRAYLQQARNLDPFLDEQSKKQVQTHMHQNIKLFNQTSIHQVMQLSKLNAQSCGRNHTRYEDYIHASKLFFGEQTFLSQTAQFKKKAQTQKKAQKPIQASQNSYQKSQNPQKPQKLQKI